MDFRSLLKLLSVNLRHNFFPHLCIAFVIVAVTPVLFGISSLDKSLAAQPIEIMLSLTGAILLTPIFLPEQNEDIRDLIRSKRMNYIAVCIIRIIYTILFLAAIIGAFVLVMHFCESNVTMQHFIGGFASALFLGSLGFTAAGLSGNVTVGYMVAMIYYIANFMLKDKLKSFYLFSMTNGCFDIKYCLILSSLLLICMTVFIIKVRRK